MANRLAASTSPYLLQHADNPVDWYEWGPEAFDRARELDRPILLSVGYAACHWCHVMAHESFEDEGIAAVVNERFVAVKVDREERPDVDAVYMQATQALTGQGGWPMTVFLTPDRQPFYAGTYFPPVPHHGLPSFGQVLDAISEAWTGRREEVLTSATSIVTQLAGQRVGAVSGDMSVDDVAAAVALLNADFDPVSAGNGVLYARDSQFVIQNGRALRGDPGINPLLLLGFDVYAAPVAHTTSRLRRDGFDLTRVHETTFQGRPMIVVGARKGDFNRKQFWIDAERLVFVRMLEPTPRDTSKMQDIRFVNYERRGGGWIAPRVEIWNEGKLVFYEDYEDVRVNVTLDDNLFVPSRWKTARHWTAGAGSR